MDDFKKSKEVLAAQLRELREELGELKSKTIKDDDSDVSFISLAERQDLLLDSIETHIFYLKKPDTYGAVNKAHASFFNLKKEDLENKNIYSILDNEGADVCVAGNTEIFKNKRSVVTEELMTNGNGEKRLYSFVKMPKFDDNGNVKYVICTGNDITEKRQAEQERENLVVDLKSALSRIKTLSGLLPICSGCKKIRDDKGYWNQIESYIQKHSEAEFSHGLCHDCSDKLYGEEDWYIKMKKKK